jgi:hypothetical protein
MRWIVRQWHRFQLARQLLAQYEHEEAHRMPWSMAIRLITEYPKSAAPREQSAADKWRKAVEAHLAAREATRGTEAS